jgi:oligopeptide/dipeptide ABC transporter ATP-binding protein
MSSASPLLAVHDLRVRFHTPEGVVRAVDGIDFSLAADETFALVGESGCGKSVTALALARLVDGPGLRIEGRVELEGREVLTMSGRELRAVRGGRIAYVFQDPTSSLNPVQTVGGQIGEMIRLHRPGTAVKPEVAALMDLVGLPEAARRMNAYPHEFSGGMQQRVMIAMALAAQPRVLVADEPTTALDVTIQAQIFDLLMRLRRRLHMGVLLITHNLGLVRANADRVAVMYAGRIMETGPTGALLAQPLHPYTRGLLASVPRVGRTGRMTGIEGRVPHPARLPAGCRFHPRCRRADARCRAVEPELEAVAEGHCVRCHHRRPDETPGL